MRRRAECADFDLRLTRDRLAFARDSFSATRDFTMRLTRAEGIGRSGVNRNVPLPALKGLSSSANFRCTKRLPGKKLQWSLKAA